MAVIAVLPYDLIAIIMAMLGVYWKIYGNVDHLIADANIFKIYDRNQKSWFFYGGFWPIYTALDIFRGLEQSM